MRIMITGATGFVSRGALQKIIDERLGQDIEFMIVQDRLGITPGFADTSDRKWISANLDEVEEYWWRDIITNNNIDTILYMESILNDTIYIPTQDDIYRYQESDARFINYYNTDSITGLNIMYLSTDNVYIGDEFPNELNTIQFIQPEGNETISNLNTMLQYASIKMNTELSLTLNDIEGLRIIRPISIVGPGQGQEFPLTSDINKAYIDEDLSSYGQGDRGIAFTHVQDLVKFILSPNLFDTLILQTLTSRIINVCRYQNYLPERTLIEKIINKLESDSDIIYNSLDDNYPYIISTPQIRNMVRIDIPSIPIEIIIEDIFDDIDPVDNYQPLEVIVVGFIPGKYLVIEGTVEPLSNISILISSGDTLSTTADENGNWRAESREAQIYAEPSSGIAYATLEGIQFSTESFDIPASS